MLSIRDGVRMKENRWLDIKTYPKNIIVWGSSDQARVNSPILEELNYKVEAYVNDYSTLESTLNGTKILHGISELEDFIKTKNHKRLGFIIAIGNPFGNVRMSLQKLLISRGLTPISFSDPSAKVCGSLIYGAGLQVMPLALIHNDVKIGQQCIINSRTVIEHDCELEDGVEIGPGSVLCGRVKVGKYTWIGANATINPRVKIGENSIIGSGAVVVRDIPDNVIAFGVPAKINKVNPTHE